MNWLNTLSEFLTPERVGGFLGAAGGAAYLAWSRSSKHGGATKAFIDADKRTGPVAPAPHPDAHPPSPELMSRLARLEGAMTEWSMAEARARVRQLEELERKLRAEVDSLRADLDDANGDNLRMSRALAAANLQLEQAQRDREAADARAEAMAAELRQHKLEIASGHSAVATVTPIRPPPKVRS